MFKTLAYYVQLQKRYLRLRSGRFIALATLFLVGIGMSLLGPQIVRFFIDTAQQQGGLSRLYIAASIFIGVGLADRATQTLTAFLSQDLAWRGTNRLRSDLVRHLLSLQLSFYSAHTPGELIERVDGDVANLGNFFSRLALAVLRGMLLLIGVLVLVSLEDLRIGMAMAGYGVLLVVVHGLGQRFMVRFYRSEREASAEFSGFVGERLGGIMDIRTTGAVPYAMRRFHESLAGWFRSELMVSIFSRITLGTTFQVQNSGFVVTIGPGAFLFQKGEITIGTLYLIVQYFGLIAGPLRELSDQVEEFQRATVSVQRIRSLFETRSQITDGVEPSMPTGPASIEFDNVSFGYGGGTEVLQAVSFRLESGSTLGLLGRTGSGKTTLSRLLLRLYDPDEGVVSTGNVDIRRVRLKDLRRQVGMVTQDVQLFRASVRDNLTLFDSSVEDSRLCGVLRDLGLDSWHDSLPEGLDSQMSGEGGQMSAGEAQLLAFARVFLKDPGIVILDEAWSRLDPATERSIDRAIAQVLEGRTGIIIAHRLSTLRLVDQVMIIDAGKVQEFGDREALASDTDSRLSQLVRAGLGEVTA